MEILEICKEAKEVEGFLGSLETTKKNKALKYVGEKLIENANYIIEENKKDMESAKKSGMSEGLLDRLMLTIDRIKSMADGIFQVADLEDPIGEITGMKQRENGLKIGQMRVPLGVIGIIYEARPNVTADAFSLCFKTGNVVILKGGKEAYYSNMAIVRVIQQSLKDMNMPKNCISYIESVDRKDTFEFIQMYDYVDVLIPRGGAGLIKFVVENATVPVIETGTGNCHIYVDETADLDMAVSIIENAKTTRLGVCNACESLVVHEKVVDALLPKLVACLQKHQVEIRGDEVVCMQDLSIIKATEEDWGREYLDAIISVKTVGNIDEAISHINHYNTKHSEAIITKDYFAAEKFLKEIDAAAVYVNASTRFTDGYEFGYGAEIGISTQKLHARGPMGLEALTSKKYIIYGQGQIR